LWFYNSAKGVSAQAAADDKNTVSVALSGVHKTVLFAKKSTRSALFSRASARSGERRTRHPGKLGASNSIG
jgi:hypothetical protein